MALQEIHDLHFFDDDDAELMMGLVKGAVPVTGDETSNSN